MRTGTFVIPHGSSVYSYHFMMTRVNAPFAEFLMMSPTGSEIVPMFSPLFVEEPVPENGRMRLSEQPGFGVELDKTLAFERPIHSLTVSAAGRLALRRRRPRMRERRGAGRRGSGQWARGTPVPLPGQRNDLAFVGPGERPRSVFLKVYLERASRRPCLAERPGLVRARWFGSA